MPAAPRRRSRWPVAVAIAAALAVAGGAIAWFVLGDEDDAVASDRAAEDDTEGDDADAPSDSDESVPRGDRLIDRCGESTLLSVPGTEIMIEPLSIEQEAAIGEDTVDEVLRTSSPSDDDATQSRLEDLLDELRPTGTDVDYQVTLLESEEVNAFAVPGGSIFFTTAITELMPDDELAFVMAHEISHVHCRHIAQEIERVGLVAAAANALLGTDLDADDIYADAAGSVIAELASLSFSRDDELEADLAALDLLEEAGRPLDAAADGLRTLMSLEGDYQPSEIDVLLSTHPPTQERIDAVEAEASRR